MKLSKTINLFAALAVVTMGLTMKADAAVTAFFSAGATCGGAATAAFSPSGPNVQVSLCVTTTTESLCSNSLFLVAANAGENGRFNLASRTLSGTYNDPTSTLVPPYAINSTANSPDLGGGRSPLAPVAPGSNQLLATFDLAPQATATNASYVLSTSAASSVEIDTDGTCANSATFPIAPTLTLTLSQAPAFTSAAPAGGVVSTAYTHTFTATGSPAPVFAVSSGALPAGLGLSGAGVLSGTPTAAGTFNFTVSASNGVLPNASQAVTLTIAAAAQTITFANPGTLNFSTTPFASNATASSGLTVSLVSNTAAVCTVSGLNITMVSAGSCSITASQPGNASFGAAPPVNQVFTINAVAPGAPTVSAAAGNLQGTLTITPPANTGGSPITGYTATCNPNAGTDANAGTTVLTRTITGLVNGVAHTCSVTATGPGGTSAAGVSNSFTPSPTPTPPIFTSPATFSGFTVGVAATTFNISATGVPTPTISQTGTLPTGVIFTSGGANAGTGTLSGTPTQAGTFNITFTAVGTAPNTNQAFTLTVNKANQTITFGAQAPRTFSATPFAISPLATTTSGLTITYTSTTPTICTVSGTTVTMVTVGTCTIAANQPGDANFNAATQQTQGIVISQAAQTITFGAQANRPFSATASSLNPLATASSGLPITYTSSTPAVCTISGSSVTTVSLGSCTITANQAGNANFSAAAAVPQSFNVTQGTQTITFSGLPNQSLGTAPFTISAFVSSGLAATFVSQTPTVCTTTGVNGSTVTLLILGTCTIQASQAGNANYSAATPATASFTVVPPGAVTLSSSTNPAAYRAPVLLSASVEGTTPTGTITFAISTPTGSVTLCSAVPMVNARATCPVSGALNIANPVFYTATYSGDGNNPANSTTLQQLVNVNSVTMNVTVNPIQPVAGRNVELRATLAGRNLTNKVSFNENGVALTGCSAVTVALLPGTTDLGVATCTVSAISAATHNYVVTYPHTADAGFEQQIVTVTPLVAAPVDYTDMWWVGSSENGWGVSITQHGMTQFIVLYVYDDNGKPIWYSMPGGAWNANQTAYTGALYQPTSAPFSLYDALQFRPGGPTGASVGTATVTYTSASTATLTYTINGKSGTKAIVRQPYATDDGQAKLQVADLWWAGASENGWGLNIAQQGRVLFPIWYTYDATGRDTWFAMPGGTWNGSVYTGDLYTTISSGWLGTNYNPSQFVVTKVGTMSLDFSDQNNAILTYTVNNLTQRKVIVRQPF